MRFQSTQASCGPASLRTALMAKGVLRSEDELAKLCRCSPTKGTSPKNLLKAVHLTAIENPNINPSAMAEAKEDVALLKLLAAIRAGCAAILCVDNFEHWVVAFGLLGDSIIHVADPANEELVLHYTPEQLTDRWRGLGRRPFYAIFV